MAADHRCDWCLRPKAPPGEKYRYLPEQKDLCFGYPDPSCIWHHGEAWDRLQAEVALLRGLLGECSGWIDDTCDVVVGMSDARLNAAHTLLGRLAAALEKDHA